MRRSKPFSVALAAMVMAFLLVLAFRGPESASPESRLPQRYRLADLIHRQQATTRELKSDVEALRRELAAERAAQSDRSAAVALREIRIAELSEITGIESVRGPGLVVTLADSKLRSPPEGGNVNDLVIHSQDVQAVVNALWRSGAEAIAINGERLVATSAVLCVGNTLLLNGTVHSPPFVISAIGASRDRFESDRLVRRLNDAASAFGIQVDVQRVDNLVLPAYRGSSKVTYARPIS